MHRFFTKEIEPDSATIRGEDVRHISRVLRLHLKDSVQICDGNGKECIGELSEITQDYVKVRIGPWSVGKSEPICKVTLFQGLPKSGKMELILQKCVELGIDAVVPMLCDRCVVQPKESFSNRLDRWQRVASEAAKQSKRCRIPEVRPLVKLNSIPVSEYDLVLIAYEEEHVLTLKQALRSKPAAKIAIVIGPEGGLEPQEVTYLKERGAVPVTLGARILRTETAGMAMLAQILYEVEA